MPRPRPSRSFGMCLCAALGLLSLLLSPALYAQISLSTAVNLSLQTDPRVKAAQADLARARAVAAESRDVFIPAVSTTGGVGRANGAPLSPPVVFGLAAQSLIYNFSQPDYIRAARAGVRSAELALASARSDVAEDAVNAYVTLDNALQRQAVQRDALAIANRLVTIEEDRFTAGVDPHLNLTEARRTAAQIRLQELQVEDEIADRTEHLAALTGLPRSGWQTVRDSIPPLEAPAASSALGDPEADDARAEQGSSAAFVTARAKQYTAHGDRRYLLRPQISLSAQFSRLSDAFSSYDFYYPGFRNQVTCDPVCAEDGKINSFNSFSLGVQLSLPLLDMVHAARARESAADAARALADAQLQQINFMEGRRRLRRNTVELAARAELAALDHDLAQDQLNATLTRLHSAAGLSGGVQETPRDEQNARLTERQRQIDLLNADLQLRNAEVTLLRQQGGLTGWLGATIPGAIAPSSPPTPATSHPATPSTGILPGVPAVPGTSAVPGNAPGHVPTTGTTPPALPSSPVTDPSPGPTQAPPSTPQTQPSAPRAPAGSPQNE